MVSVTLHPSNAAAILDELTDKVEPLTFQFSFLCILRDPSVFINLREVGLSEPSQIMLGR